jgi:hypothetical protein
MSGLSVDTEALGGLAVRMARTRDDVAYAARLVGDCADGGASTAAATAVATSLAEFDDHWRYGLKKLVANLDACHGALHDAASAYEQVEQSIARAAAGD